MRTAAYWARRRHGFALSGSAAAASGPRPRRSRRERVQTWPSEVVAEKYPVLARRPPRGIPSDIEDEERRFRARAAGCLLVVCGPLLIGEIEVAVIRHAFEHGRDTGAAQPLLAGERQLDIVGEQHVGDALVGRDGEGEAAPGGAHSEDVPCDIDIGGEILGVYVICGPTEARRPARHMLHEAAGAAGIKMRVRIWLCEARVKVELLLSRAVVQMQRNPVRERRAL